MKIAQVCPYDFTRHGGVKTHILQLASALRKQGHEVKIIAPKTTAADSEEDVYFFGKNMSLGFGGTKIDMNVCLGNERRRLITFLESEQFDVIHYHTIWNPVLPFQVLRFSKARNVATFHDTPGKGFIPQFLGRWVMPLVARVVFRKLHGIISVSPSQAAYISRFSNRAITIIPNGIDVEAVTGNSLSDLKDGKRTILFLGRLEPRKGIMEALAVFKKLSEKHSDIRLIVAGTGDMLAQAQAFVADHEMAHVLFVGSVSDQEKWNLFATADLYIAPALYGESFGIVLLEAMAAGVPMAGYGNEGYLNILSKEQVAYFAKPGDTAALVQHFDALLTSPALRDRLILHGKERALSYDWQHLSRDILKVYG